MRMKNTLQYKRSGQVAPEDLFQLLSKFRYLPNLAMFLHQATLGHIMVGYNGTTINGSKHSVSNFLTCSIKDIELGMTIKPFGGFILALNKSFDAR